ncbi:hypothetical protein Syun_004631 [Stephania yunnanensis]|uniref:Uncharacterized protein n=1 Tax=Stephania yunnanensis TaxID=152371 RepID=A0AAP0L6R2_9MAGN
MIFFLSPPHLFFRSLFLLYVSLSSSFSSISRDTPQCCSLHIFVGRNNSCLYQVSYGDGSYTVGDGSHTVGDRISETLTFNDVASVDNIAHGCSHNIEGLFVGAAGFYKGVTTSKFDELAAETAAAMTANHPDYASVNVLVLVWVLGRWGSGNFNWGFDFLVLYRGGDGQRWRRSDCGFGDIGDQPETAVYEAVRTGFGGARGCRRGRGGVVRHALRSESTGERERADIGLRFRLSLSHVLLDRCSSLLSYLFDQFRGVVVGVDVVAVTVMVAWECKGGWEVRRRELDQVKGKRKKQRIVEEGETVRGKGAKKKIGEDFDPRPDQIRLWNNQ